MTVKLRYKEPNGEDSRLLTYPVRDGEVANPPASADFDFATAVVEFALLLRGSEHKGQASFENVVERARRSRGADPDGDRAEFLRLVSLAATLATPAGSAHVTR